MPYKDPAVASAKNIAKLRALRERPGYSRQKNAAWQAQHPEKRAAHKAVEQAILRGALTRMPCVRCGAQKAEAHHDDYSKPIEVTWLCRSHHVARHKELRSLSCSSTTAGVAALSSDVSSKNATTFLVAAASRIISKPSSTASIPTT